MTAALLLAAALFTEGKFGSMPYVFFVPAQYDGKRALPLILWLHGAGARGEDPKDILAYGDQDGPLFFARDDNQQQHPAFVLAPQCPRDRFWSDAEETRELMTVLLLLRDVQRRYRIDARRIYVAGISMGGYGTWDLIARHPDLFAAALPMCGGGVPRYAARITTPVWAFHGADDKVVSPQESRDMVEAMRQAGRHPRYSEYPGVGHDVWKRAFQERDLLKWLLAQELRH
jgi:predicted peptidase